MLSSIQRPLVSGWIVVLFIFFTDTTIAQQSRVFATSTFHDGNLGGLAGADAICEQRAIAAALGAGPWVAWLSTNGPGAVDARDRLTPDSGPFVRAAQPGTVIANDISDLTDGILQSAIALDEFGNTPAVVIGVKTGTKEDGTAEAFTCDDWTVAGSGTQTIGLITATDATWTQSGLPLGCGIENRIYCFEDPATVQTMDSLGLCVLALLLTAAGLIFLPRLRTIS